MAWLNFPLSAGGLVQPCFLELSTAYYERKLAAVGGAAPTIGGNPGDNIQRAVGSGYESYRDWQAWMEANCTSFIRTDLTYDGGGAPANPVNWDYDLATFRTAAGLNASGFTRRYWRQFAGPAATDYDDGNAFSDGDKALDTTRNVVCHRVTGAWVDLGGPWGATFPDVVTTYGLMEPGDIIDSLTVNEIFRGFVALSWGRRGLTPADFTASSGDNNPGRGGAPLPYTWAAAKSDAESSWDTGSPAPSTGVRDAANPTAYTLGWYNYVGGNPEPEAEIQGQRCRYPIDLSSVWAGVPRDIEFYAYATPPPLHQTAGPGDSVFDDNGFLLAENDWRKFDSTAATSSTGTLNSSYLGKSAVTDYPAWCDEPLPAPVSPAAGPTKEQGFYVSGAQAIIKFKFSKP